MDPRRLLGGVRRRVTLATILVVAVSMSVLTAVVAWGVRATVEASVRDSLEERLDVAEHRLSAGDLSGAVDGTGPVVVQVLDAKGKVLASSADELSELPIIAAAREGLDVDDFLEREDDDDDSARADDQDDGADATQEPAPAEAGPQDEADPAGSESRQDAVAWNGDADDVDDADDWDDDRWDDDRWDDADEDDWDDDDDDDDDDLDDDDFENAIVWHHRKLASLVRPIVLPEGEAPEVDGAALAAIEEDLGLIGPFLTSVRTAAYQKGQVTVVAIASMASAVEAATSAGKLLAKVSVAVIAGAALFTFLMVGRTLSPVEQMRADTEHIVQEAPGERLAVPDGDRDLKLLAATFNDLLSRSEQALIDQRRFISDASHQLKSPVAAQSMMIETLRAHPDAPDRDEVLDDLARENNRLQHIVEDLLALARYDEGAPVARVPVDLIDVIFDEVSPYVAGTTVSIDTSAVEPVEVQGDARHLGQAVRNLLDNAVRHATHEVRVSCSESGGVARIAVSDDGPGIAEGDRERVFERFVRLETDERLLAGSTGLGLSVVRGIVEGHGGQVRFVEPEMGGATVVIELPTGMQ